MRRKWVSLRTLKVHEFHRTLRHLRHIGRTWHDIYIRLGEMQQEATNRFLKSLSTLLVIYLLLQSLGKGSTVSLNLLQVTASIPIAYVATVGAISLFIVIQQLQSVIMIIGIRSAESTRMRLPGFSANMYGLYNGQDEMALAVPVVVNRHVREIAPISSLLSITTMIVYLSMLMPIIAYSAFLLSWQIHIFGLAGIPWIERAAAIVGIFAIFQSYAFVLLFNIPFPVTKNTFSIRWGILYGLHPFGSHPRSKLWLDDPKK